MASSLSQEPKKLSLYRDKFRIKQNISKIWQKTNAPSCVAGSLPEQVLSDLEKTFSALIPGPAFDFSGELEKIKKALLAARIQAVLARSQSMPLPQRQKLCREAMEKYELAQSFFMNLKLATVRGSTEERRRVRAIEGAPEWRAIRHLIRKSAELVSLNPQ